MGTVLYPKDSDLAVSLPDADAQAGLMAGTHLVPMVDNAGETVGLSQQDATRALADGSHRQPNEAEMQHMLKTSKYGQGSQRFTADVEAAGRGIVPGSDALLRLGGVNPEEIQARKEANSETGVIEGAGFLASALTGKGIAAGLTKAGNLTEKTAAKVAEHVIENKVGQAALTGAARLAAESVIYQANDELNSAIRNDPNSSAEAALAHIGTAALFGGVGGAALFGAPALWKATIGPKADEALSGFVSRAKFYLENPNPVESATSELTDLHSKTHAAQFEPYGEGGSKMEALKKLIPETTPAMTENCIEQLNKIGDLAGKIGQSADSRVQHLSKNLDAILANGNQKFQAAKTGAEMFDALDSTKKELYNAYKGINTNLNPHYDMVKKDMETLYNSFRTNLEGVNVWGKAGDFQKNLNKAVATFIPSAKAARKAGFITNITGKETINPGTVKTFINQSLNETGSPQLRQTILGNHIEASNGLINAVNESRSIAGLDALPNLSESPVLKEAMSESSMGKQFADLFMKKAMTSGLAGVTGGAIGSALGHPFIGYFVGKQALTPMFKHIMPNMLNKLFANSTSAAGFKAGSSYLQAVVKGAAKTEEAIVAAASGEKLSLVSKSENKVDDLKKVVDGFEQNPDLVNQLPADLGHYLPEHNSALVASATKTISYLSSLKVRTPNTLPFDGKFVASKEQDARYESALKIANNPLSVLDKVRSGQITPNDIADLNAMAPALADRLRQGLTTQLVSNKQAGKSVPYKTQLGMSLFLGQPLASSMQSFSIQASQPAMAAPNQPAKSVKNGDKLSKMPNLYQTSDQSRQLSRQNRK